VTGGFWFRTAGFSSGTLALLTVSITVENLRRMEDRDGFVSDL